jgi:UDP-glucose 6-dehydrogenase
MDINTDQRTSPIRKLKALLGGSRTQDGGDPGTGLQANTDDMRDAPAIDIVRH